jgi:hypothetical protein
LKRSGKLRSIFGPSGLRQDLPALRFALRACRCVKFEGWKTRLVSSHSSSSNRLVFTVIEREKAVTYVTLDSERHYKIPLQLWCLVMGSTGNDERSRSAQ